MVVFGPRPAGGRPDGERKGHKTVLLLFVQKPFALCPWNHGVVLRHLVANLSCFFITKVFS